MPGQKEISEATGKSLLRLAQLRCAMRPAEAKAPRPEKLISQAFSAPNGQPVHPRIFPLSFLQKSCMTPSIPPHREGRTRGRHDTWGGDAVAVSGRSVDSAMPTNDCDADVKSCGPGLPVLRPRGSCPLRGRPATGTRTPIPGASTYKR